MISMRPSKKRKLKTDQASKLRRKAYALETRNPVIKAKRQKAAKAYYKKNKSKLLAKAKVTRQARK